VPPLEIFAGCKLAIGARRRQPVERALVAGLERDAVRHELVALGVAPAAATLAVQQLACDVRVHDFARRFVLKFLQAASAAAVAQGFPLLGRKLGELLVLPERL
jgi:hypothetical protein